MSKLKFTSCGGKFIAWSSNDSGFITPSAALRPRTIFERNGTMDTMEMWKTPLGYNGPDFSDYYVIWRYYPNPDPREQTNGEVIYRELSALAGKHLEYGDNALLLHKDAPEAAIDAATGILNSLADYPVLDDVRVSELEYEAACEAWRCYSTRGRIDLIRRYGNGEVSIFAARREDPPVAGDIIHVLVY